MAATLVEFLNVSQVLASQNKPVYNYIICCSDHYECMWLYGIIYMIITIIYLKYNFVILSDKIILRLVGVAWYPYWYSNHSSDSGINPLIKTKDL